MVSARTKSLYPCSLHSDGTRLSERERRIKRNDTTLTPAAVVCERHFKSRFIEQSFTIIVNSDVNYLRRESRLKADAIRTIFKCPTHVVSKLEQKIRQNKISVRKNFQ